MIILIDITKANNQILSLAEKTDWWERISQLGGDCVIWDQSDDFPEKDIPVVSQWEELVELAISKQSKDLIFIEIDQIFLDPEICKQGLGSAGDGWDYFTQWEFSRLPVGIGLRSFSLENQKIRDWGGSPTQLLDFINQHPNDFSLRYDTNRHVSFRESLLDSRYSSRLGAVLDNGEKGIEFGLQGFLGLAHAHGGKGFDFEPEEKVGRFDERKMIVPFGFESPQCAVFPTYIMFDLTNICNARCVHCPQGVPEFRQKIGKGVFLSDDRFKKAIDECAGRKIDFVRITADGEPLIHKEVIPLIRYASEKGVGPVGLTTNGSLLTEERIDGLLESGLFMIDISLDAIRPETYKTVRRGLNYEKVNKNIHNLIEKRDQLGGSLQIMVSFVKQPANLDEVGEFEAYWGKYIDKVLIREMISNVGLNEVEGQDSAPKRWPCPHWFRRAVINYDGRLKACPIDWDNRSAYKSLDEVSIYDTWHSDYYWQHRIEHLNNQFSADSICGPCGDWQGTPWDLGYEKVIKNMSETEG
jgi:pyruvate-formate lyase-activating enzyme